MLGALRAAISFFTTIKLDGDFESFRRNLWLTPFVGILIGLIVSIPKIFDIPHSQFFCLLIYVAVEGINHIDGLADFGDAFFAPKDRKKKALKDLNLGAGGVIFVSMYFLSLYHFLRYVEFEDLIFSQFLAKYVMLLFLVFSKPAWEGMASELMKFSKKRDVFVGFLPFFFFLDQEKILILIISIIIFLLIKKYSEINFGGVNGDVIGASNCITFSTSLIFSSLL
ncbi:MAG: adenosylcobinamide-GDP ribazoletransferase [Archaeoglobaceae archaeon]|nr:adenosylcobinamide-GDP ribazoletransferase [Archaeoglobaceae archaeon]MCX8152367.1 adenosylcobinamide-GDP ribazoletransferase [Archaeoglobaceae archaeon]MDW8014174.1 adenosylcobinamide-GDP ribazoletransferase [Archaeoglobaceae archaeon]